MWYFLISRRYLPIPGLSQAAVSYIKKNYKQRELLEECVAFVGCNIEDAPPHLLMYWLNELAFSLGQKHQEIWTRL